MEVVLKLFPCVIYRICFIINFHSSITLSLLLLLFPLLDFLCHSHYYLVNLFNLFPSLGWITQALSQGVRKSVFLDHLPSVLLLQLSRFSFNYHRNMSMKVTHFSPFYECIICWDSSTCYIHVYTCVDLSVCHKDIIAHYQSMLFLIHFPCRHLLFLTFIRLIVRLNILWSYLYQSHSYQRNSKRNYCSYNLNLHWEHPLFYPHLLSLPLPLTVAGNHKVSLYFSWTCFHFLFFGIFEYWFLLLSLFLIFYLYLLLLLLLLLFPIVIIWTSLFLPSFIFISNLLFFFKEVLFFTIHIFSWCFFFLFFASISYSISFSSLFAS